jgi:hypothetical protein
MADVTLKTTLDSVADDGSFSIIKQRYTEVEGVEMEVGLPERRAFMPGEFDELSQYAPEFKSMCDYLWTPERVAAWKGKVARIAPETPRAAMVAGVQRSSRRT